jgi:hypothetical protein
MRMMKYDNKTANLGDCWIEGVAWSWRICLYTGKS